MTRFDPKALKSDVRLFLSWWRGLLLELLPERPRAGVLASLHGWTRCERVMAVIALAGWSGALLIVPVTRPAEIARLSAEVENLRAPAAAAASIRERLRIMQEPVTAASARLALPDALDTIRALTLALPGDVQLSDLEIGGTGVRIAGTARNARQVVAALIRSGRFAHVELRRQAALDRFEIEMLAR